MFLKLLYHFLFFLLFIFLALKQTFYFCFLILIFNTFFDSHSRLWIDSHSTSTTSYPNTTTTTATTAIRVFLSFFLYDMIDVCMYVWGYSKKQNGMNLHIICRIMNMILLNTLKNINAQQWADALKSIPLNTIDKRHKCTSNATPTDCLCRPPISSGRADLLASIRTFDATKLKKCDEWRLSLWLNKKIITFVFQKLLKTKTNGILTRKCEHKKERKKKERNWE